MSAKKYLEDPNFRRMMDSLMNIKLTTVAASGYFDPIHVGHIKMIQAATFYGEVTIVLVISNTLRWQEH